MADWTCKDCPNAPVEVDFEVTLIHNQLCQLNKTGFNAGLNWKMLSNSSWADSSSSSKPNFEPPQNAVRQRKGVWYALQSTYGTLKFLV